MIVTVTLNPAVDHTIQVDSLPAPETVARTDDAHLDAGGKGINVSKYLTELGAETVATGFVGDVLGEFIRDRLDEADIRGEFVDVDASTRLNTTILTDEAEYKINQNGPTVGQDAIDDVVDTVRGLAPSMVVVAGSQPPGVDAADVDRIARAGPWRTAVDVGGDTLRELDAEYALCKPNQAELEAATGGSVETLAEYVAAAERLRDDGFDTVVASLGDEGAIAVTAEESLHAHALDVDVVDTVGAGDALLAGVLSEFEAGASIREALRRGVVTASCAVSVPGTAVPAFSECQVAVDDVSISAR